MQSDRSSDENAFPGPYGGTLPNTPLGLVAQELKDRLGAIRAFSELIQMEPGQADRVQENVGNLMRAVRKAQSLLTQAESLDHQLRQRRRPLHLQPIVRASADLLRAISPTSLSFAITLDPETPIVLGDPVQLHQLVLQLGLRSLHALRGAIATLEIQLDPCEITETVANTEPGLRPGHYARLTLVDTGEGLDTEFLQRAIAAVPNPNRAQDPVAALLGIAQQITSSHQGTLEMLCDPRGGTTARVYLPAHATIRHRLVAPGLPLGHGENILFVDDDPAQCSSTHQILERLGFAPKVFSDPQAALAAYQKDPSFCDVAILDLNMPRITGIDLATHLLESRPELPVYLVTGLQGPWTPEMARILGIRGVLARPLAPATWCLTLHEALQR